MAASQQICCVTSWEFDEKRATKPKFIAQSWPWLYFEQQLSSTRNKRFCWATSWSCKVKNETHRPETWKETMLRDKFRVFVSRISLPLELLALKKHPAYSMNGVQCKLTDTGPWLDPKGTPVITALDPLSPEFECDLPRPFCSPPWESEEAWAPLIGTLT